MSIPKCHWMVIVVNLIKQTWFLCMVLPVGVALCMLGRYQVFPPQAAITATRRCGMPAIRRCRRSVGFLPIYPTGHGGAQQDYRVDCPCWLLHGPIHPQKMIYGLTVWRSCSLLPLGDVALLKEIKDHLSMVRCGIIILVVVVIPEMLLGKWH